MPPKKKAKVPQLTNLASFPTSSTSILSPRSISILIVLSSELSSPRESLNLYVMFDGVIIFTDIWEDDKEFELESLPVDLKDPVSQTLVANTPLIFFVRAAAASSKGKQDADPLLHTANRAGGNVDLWPLVLGEEHILVKVPLMSVEEYTYGELSSLFITVNAITQGTVPEKTKIPLLVTMISAHCLPPPSKEGTVYIAAIGLDSFEGDEDMKVVHFGMSLSHALCEKSVWATASAGRVISSTTYNVANEDRFIPEDLFIREASSCRSMYWNALSRAQVDPVQLRDRLASPFFFEMAGVPRTGKRDIRGRYMGFIDAAALLEPGERGLTVCARLKYYEETENFRPLLDLPSSSAKASARITGNVLDEFDHSTHITIRLDLLEPLIPKVKLLTLYEMIGLPPPEGQQTDQDILYIAPPPEDPTVNVRKMRVDCGALAVHKELSGLACRGAVPMNQGIKRTAANRLLTRIRTMLKQFPPGDCSYIEWQDTVTGQHAAARRAVSHSFAPQPPPPRLSVISAASRCRVAGDTRVSDLYTENNFKANSKHPRTLLSKALRCLEARNDKEAKEYILQGLSSQTRSRFLLWIYGAQEFNQGEDAAEAAKTALRIAVKGDYNNGTACAIGWAALHALDHYDYRPYAAFVAAKKMRKSYELVKEWKVFLRRWIDTSGEEETLWTPGAINSFNPMLIASAFFLCLRCYTFSERLLQCYEEGCATRGSRIELVTKITSDVYYLRAVSWLLRRQIDEALKTTNQGIKRFGPTPLLLQMQATCLNRLHGWDEACEAALCDAVSSGADPSPSLLLSSALFTMRENPHKALQRAARAHKENPSGYTALAIGRIYMRLDDSNLAERWAAVAVKYEPYLADGWAFLAVLALRDKLIDKARAMLRTARQVGPVSEDIEYQLRKLMDIVKVEKLSDKMMKDLCLCDYLEPLDKTNE